MSRVCSTSQTGSAVHQMHVTEKSSPDYNEQKRGITVIYPSHAMFKDMDNWTSHFLTSKIPKILRLDAS